MRAWEVLVFDFLLWEAKAPCGHGMAFGASVVNDVPPEIECAVHLGLSPKMTRTPGLTVVNSAVYPMGVVTFGTLILKCHA